MLSNPLFYWVAATVETSHTPIDTIRTPIASVRTPIVMGVALYRKGWLVVQLFYYVKFGGFLLLPLGWGKFNTSHTPITPRATPSATGNQIELQIQPIINKEKVKNKFLLVRK
jgi:hypothetical protein